MKPIPTTTGPLVVTWAEVARACGYKHAGSARRAARRAGCALVYSRPARKGCERRARGIAPRDLGKLVDYATSCGK